MNLLSPFSFFRLLHLFKMAAATSSSTHILTTDGQFKMWLTSETGVPLQLLTNTEKKQRGIGTAHQYVGAPSGKRFKIHLQNNKREKCDTTLKFEGKEMGKFRVDPYQTFVVERPSDEDKSFMVHAEQSATGKAAGVVAGKKENGVIEVHVVFEKPQSPPVQMRSIGRSMDGAFGAPPSRGGGGEFLGFFGDDDLAGSMDIPKSKGIQKKRSKQNNNNDSKHTGFGVSFGADPPSPRYTQSLNPQPTTYAAAALALGESTGQTFGSVSAITDIGVEYHFTLRVLALVEKKKEPEKSVAIAALPAKKPSTPPRIDDIDNVMSTE